ncbi:LysR substrate-binding domain-containing protein [Rhizobium daejeonense]
MSSIHNADLNLIRVFVAVYDERGVTKASERLNITQSAVSHALAKLRIALEDELFVRGPSGMHPTPRAEELARAFRVGLDHIDGALATARFDPRTADMEFVISTSDYLASTLFPSVMRRLETEAPNVRLWLRPLSDVSLVEELDRGALHLALGSFGKVPARLLREPVFSEPNVWMMRKGHPAAASPLTVEALAAYPHIDILVSRRGDATLSGTIDQGGLERAYVTSNPHHLEGLLARKGLSRRVGLTVSHILAIPALIASTDMIVLIPKRFAEANARTYGLVHFEPPYETALLQISMVTHRVMGAHPSVAWLREILLGAVDLPHSHE